MYKKINDGLISTAFERDKYVVSPTFKALEATFGVPFKMRIGTMYEGPRIDTIGHVCEFSCRNIATWILGPCFIINSDQFMFEITYRFHNL